MPTQGPFLVSNGVDGGDFGAPPNQFAWSNPANVAQSSASSVATAVPNGGPSHNLTNTLKCQFSTGVFSVPSVVSQIIVSFKATAASSGYNCRVNSVKTSITGSTDKGDEASLSTVDPSFTTFSYTFSGLAIPAATVNGTWEFELVIDWDGVSGSVGTVEIYDATAQATYGGISVGEQFVAIATLPDQALANRHAAISRAIPYRCQDRHKLLLAPRRFWMPEPHYPLAV